MNIRPVASPAAIKPTAPNPNAVADAKARAVAAFGGQQAPQNNAHPVQNPSNITPEELTAVKPSGQNREDVSQAPVVTEETQIPKPEITEQSASSTMAALARREKAIRAKAQQQNEQLKQRETQLAAREAALAERENKRQDVDLSQYIPKSQLKDSVVETLEAEGLSYDDVTQQFVNRQPRNPRYEQIIEKQEQRMAKLQEKIDSFEKNQVETQTQSYNAALKQIERDTQTLVSTEPDAYEMIKATNSVKDVVDLIEATFKEEGRVMSVEDAAAEVEEYLVEEAMKLANTKKIKSRYSTSATQESDSKQTPSPNTQKQPMKTLTNSVSSTRQLNSRERALLAFEGKLNK